MKKNEQKKGARTQAQLQGVQGVGGRYTDVPAGKDHAAA